MNIPLEDTFADILGKAQRGLGLTDEALAARASLEVPELLSLKEGTVNASALTSLAPALDLKADALLALAESRYQAAAVPPLDGLAQFNTVFEDMTVNSYVVWDPASREAAFFDTGADGEPMLDFARKQGLAIRQIFLTHTHGDHVLDLDRLKEKTGAKSFVGELELFDGAEPFSAGREFQIGSLVVETRLTSGHAVGGITYVVRGLLHPVAIVGDSLFAGSMGGGMISYADALRNNREQVFSLPDETILCPGHGPLTTVGEQKISNPFFPNL